MREDRPRILAGYDDRGILYDREDYLFREVYPPYRDEMRDIFQRCHQLGLKRMGIVETELAEDGSGLLHRKHVISYPFEWTENMFKDAALFHLDLLAGLDRHGLTLKDALPGNIVFDSCKPVFIDFLSILPKDLLKHEAWLMENSRQPEPARTVLNKMFIPFFLMPFVAMAEGKHALARRLLAEKACNCPGVPPRWQDIYAPRDILSRAKILRDLLGDVLQAGAGKLLGRRPDYHHFSCVFSVLTRRNLSGFTDFVRQLRDFIDGKAVTPPATGYLSYYREKKQDFNGEGDAASWKEKQKNVHRILQDEQPRRVLDLGANTGWFSILAANLGAEVIATDIDEAAIDALYLQARNQQLKILPLLLPFAGMDREVYGIADEAAVYRDRDFTAVPLFLAARKRIGAEMVLCLGLLHHLILGMGKEMEKIMETMAALADRCLVIEYVDLEDMMIRTEPAFFSCLSRHSRDTYSLDGLIACGRRYFRDVEILNSHPATRKLVVFHK